MINADKPHLWKDDIRKSVDLFNNWFLNFAPKAYRETRLQTTKHVEDALHATRDHASITLDVLQQNPSILPALRMSTCPPLARDRLIGLADVNKSLVLVMETGKLATRMPARTLNENLRRIAAIISRMLDADIFPWLSAGVTPTPEERHRASTIVADRLCGAVSDPIVRNAQEKRQLAYISEYLKKKGYKEQPHPVTEALQAMKPGTFGFHVNVKVGVKHKVNIPADVIVQPKRPRQNKVPLLIEAKSAGDFTNVNKRRKEEATKIRQIRATYGDDAQFLLFLCGYFDSGYLGYEAAEGIDWIWEHRIKDLDRAGL